MSSRPARAAALGRMPTKALAGIGTRRTTAQVAAEKKVEADAKAQKISDELNAKEQLQQRIGDMEDNLQRKTAQRAKHASRPDLLDKPSSTEDNTDAHEQAPDSQTIRAEKAKAPTRSNPARSPALANQADGESFENVVEADQDTSSDIRPGNHRKSALESLEDTGTATHPQSDIHQSDFDNFGSGSDSDYEQGDDDDGDDEDEDKGSVSEEEEGKRRRPPKKLLKTRDPKTSKAAKGSAFRAGVVEHRKTNPASALGKTVANKLKRKQEQLEADNADIGIKKTKKEAPSGLLQGFKYKAKKVTLPDDDNEDEDEPFEYNGGFFDGDEDESTLSSGRMGKVSGKKGASARGDVLVQEPEPRKPVATKQAKRDLCKVTNLPFPPNLHHRCSQIWKTSIKATLIHWNASLANPYESGTVIGEEIKVVWGKSELGKLAPMDDDDERWPIVEVVANDFLLNHRSDIGRKILKIVVQTFRDELEVELERGKGREAGINAAKFLLQDVRFVYGNPDAEKNESAFPFQGPLVLRAFNYHIKQVAHLLSNYKSKTAIGGIALCTAAVERALCLIRDGVLNIEVWPPAGEKSTSSGGGKRVKSLYPPFSEQKWGSQVRAYAEAAQKLTRDQWKDIVDAADAVDEGEEGYDGTTTGSEGDLLEDIRANLRM